MHGLFAVDYLQSFLTFSLVVVYHRQIIKTIRDPYDVIVVCHDNRLFLDAKTEIFGLNFTLGRAFNLDFKILQNVFWNLLNSYDCERGMVRNLYGTRSCIFFFCLPTQSLDVDRNVYCNSLSHTTSRRTLRLIFMRQKRNLYDQPTFHGQPIA